MEIYKKNFGEIKPFQLQPTPKNPNDEKEKFKILFETYIGKRFFIIKKY